MGCKIFVPSIFTCFFMMYRSSAIFAMLLVVFCNASSQKLVVTHSGYRINGDIVTDSNIVKLLAPYKDSINKTMTAVIGFSTDGLTKKQPESGLGNFMADAMRQMATEKFNANVHAAFINYGGIRSYLPKGNITIGSIFEIMPFDNLIVLQDIKGDSLLSFINAIAEKNGWPISGITFSIKDRKAINIMVDGKPLEVKATYTIANSDYIANGGDNIKMLKPFSQKNIGYLFRDALIAYTQSLTEKGQSIDVKTEKRIVYAR
jgi:2',3'-cyclic-nucleotide 2'-phosphodiesterase (5'-nucleotidase family)